jgi:hypothetical protein
MFSSNPCRSTRWQELFFFPYCHLFLLKFSRDWRSESLALCFAFICYRSYSTLNIIVYLHFNGWHKYPQKVLQCCTAHQYCHPKKFICSVVKPLFKEGDNKDINNYRPISLLTSFSKIFAKVIYISLSKHIKSNDILFIDQYGFRSNSSTELKKQCLNF